jgi:hypothetical protein
MCKVAQSSHYQTLKGFKLLRKLHSRRRSAFGVSLSSL